MAQCQQCAHVLSDALEISDLRIEGCLPEVTEEEANQALRSLANGLKQPSQQNAIAKKKCIDNQTSEKPGWRNFLGRLAAASGLSNASGTIGDMLPTPILTRKK